MSSETARLIVMTFVGCVGGAILADSIGMSSNEIVAAAMIGAALGFAFSP